LKKNKLEVIPLIDDFSQWLAEADKSDNTIKTYRAVLNQFHEWLLSEGMDLNHLKKKDVQQYITYLESQNKSLATVEKAFATISMFARFLKKLDVVQDIKRKQKDKKNQEAPDSLTLDECNHLLAEVKKDGNPRDIAIVYVLLHTGIRVSELCGLNQDDINLTTNQSSLTVHESRGEKGRTIPLSKEVKYYLEKYITSQNNDKEFLFESNFHQRITPRAVQYMLKKYNVTPHKLRHTFCNQLVQKGIDIAVVAELAGHLDINVTKKYLKSPVQNLDSAIKQAFS
jgi:integrase/recombinase XerD